jgi:hypothetical protein
LPLVTAVVTVAADGFSVSSTGPTAPEVPASYRVWQLPQFSVKIVLPSAAWS